MYTKSDLNICVNLATIADAKVFIHCPEQQDVESGSDYLSDSENIIKSQPTIQMGIIFRDTTYVAKQHNSVWLVGIVGKSLAMICL